MSPKTAPSFLLVDAEIGDKRRLVIPKPALAVLSWAASIAPQSPAVFEMISGGLAHLLPGAAYIAALSSIGDDADARADLEMVMEPARWERPNRITVPRAVALHLLGGGVLCGPIYIRATYTRLELWSVALRERRLAEARERLTDHLGD